MQRFNVARATVCGGVVSRGYVCTSFGRRMACKPTCVPQITVPMYLLWSNTNCRPASRICPYAKEGGVLSDSVAAESNGQVCTPLMYCPACIAQRVFVSVYTW